MSSAAQQEANQANAQHSTGPRTEQGKKRASMNATRHNLTGQVIMLPQEDAAHYLQFCKNIHGAYKPEGHLEIQIAQSIADDEWRLNRIRAIEFVAVASGHYTEEGDTRCDNAEIHAAVTQVNVFWNNPEKLALYSLYEQRITRNLHKNEKRLKTLQAERRAALEQALEEARLLAELAQSRGETYDAALDFPTFTAKNGFVFSTPELVRQIDRNHRLSQARKLYKPGPASPRTFRNAA